MLYLAAYQGLRACEIAGLRRENVHDLDDPPHLVVLGKGSKERVLPLQPRVLAELQAYGLPRRGPVFTMYDNLDRRTTRPISPARVSAACGAYLAKAGTGSHPAPAGGTCATSPTWCCNARTAAIPDPCDLPGSALGARLSPAIPGSVTAGSRTVTRRQ